MSNEPSVPITLRIPASLHDELRAIAEAEDRSIASIFRQAARQLVARRQAVPAAPPQPAQPTMNLLESAERPG